ncbi:ABC transporter ATP-binding protein [Azospirillum rugosum]|uniref:Spermidine/putrescine transport system ATP-binding protein n=1 Tax=Azospirillum rugosum TaxID=416170 RepID=A0ABS4SUJ8_9PROT|nr:ABC transporter ATP-binding protein [Azospirillum rugosum]MBP2295894.1 spermidine/putrescine transport system ATP-binding protein [Azospirillum rugosum]MDQ0530151.1 spermidine/putrescine transport system ATP-binding protein [Azospirillum rugosum]
MSQDVQLDSVTMRFGAVTAVRNVSLGIRAGEFFSFLGPSGCGKTTILRMISGFMEPTEGAIRIGGRDMRGIGPNKRPTALIFQNLALFPLMTVAENIGFGLEVRGIPAADRKKRVQQLLDLVALPETADKKVTELSGGQRQRIAIARALAVEPAVLLLDEPLSALDLKLRQHMRAELRDLQKRTGVTFIYITHDQGEALTMSDRIGVMSKGVLEQVGDGRSVYDHPETAFVASFVGESNRFTGTVADADGNRAALDTPHGRLVGRNPRNLRPGDRATLFVRPERVAAGTGAENVLESRVTHRDFEGAFINAFLEGDITVQIPHVGTEPPFTPGQPARVAFRADDAVVLPE